MNKNVYKKDRIRTVVLYVCGAVAVLSCVALIAFFIFTLHLRTEYRACCLEINDRILASYAQEDRTIRMGNESCPMDGAVQDYYDRILLDAKTIVYNRRSFEPDDKCLILEFSGCRLIFRDLREGHWIGLRWETPEGTRCYSVASGDYTFMQMTAFFQNTLRRTGG